MRGSSSHLLNHWRFTNNEPFSSLGFAFRSGLHLAIARSCPRSLAATNSIRHRPADTSELLASERQVDYGGRLGLAHRAVSARKPDPVAVALFAAKPGAVSQGDRVLCGHRTADRHPGLQSNPLGVGYAFTYCLLAGKGRNRSVV